MRLDKVALVWAPGVHKVSHGAPHLSPLGLGYKFYFHENGYIFGAYIRKLDYEGIKEKARKWKKVNGK